MTGANKHSNRPRTKSRVQVPPNRPSHRALLGIHSKRSRTLGKSSRAKIHAVSTVIFVLNLVAKNRCTGTVLRELNKNTSIDATSRAKLGEAVKGVAPDNIRAVVPAHCVDAKQQVECLIDQATDPNLLGRLWVGWQPFI